MSIVEFPRRSFPASGAWSAEELQALIALFRAEGETSFATGATEHGDPQFYLLGPAPAREASFRKKDIASWRPAAERECLPVCAPSRQLTPDGGSHSGHALDREAGFVAPRWVDHVPAEYYRAVELSHSPVTAA